MRRPGGTRGRDLKYCFGMRVWVAILSLLVLAGCGDSTLRQHAADASDLDTRSDTPGDATGDSAPDVRPDATGPDLPEPRDTGDDVELDVVEVGMDAAPDTPPVTGPPPNKFGIGLVSPGNTTQWDLTADLTGAGGHIKLIFPGVTRDMGSAPQEWIDAVSNVYDRDLVPVIRIGPPWGDRFVRDQADDPGTYKRYPSLGGAYARVIASLPRRDGWPLWIEVHNEANLCYEWECRRDSVEGGWIGYEQTAAEYASFLRDVIVAIRTINDPRIKVTIGGLAPGGTVRCECEGDGFQPGITAVEFLQAMRAEVPDIFDQLDGWATHSYPASGLGFGFFSPYDQSGPGLTFFEHELAEIGRPELPVLVTETGWTTEFGSRDEIAGWTVEAYRGHWLTDPRIVGVMPFILQDGNWDRFAWVDPGGTPYPVYHRVRELRCETIAGRCP